MDSSPSSSPAASTQSPIVYRRVRFDESARIAEFQSAMALETEGKGLNTSEVTKAIEYMHGAPMHGFYIVGALSSEQQTAVSSELLTFGHDIFRGLDVWWFQSVYVEQAHRGKGIFKGMFHEVEKINVHAPRPLRLYVEVENTRAQQVYQRLGMFDTNEVFIEDDFTFGGASLAYNPPVAATSNISVSLCNDRQLDEYLLALQSSDFTSLMGKDTAITDITATSASIEYIKANPDLGQVFVITESTDSTATAAIAYIPVFFEFSDWRNGNMIYNYDFRVAHKHQESLPELLALYLHFIKTQYVPKVKLTNIRWIVNEKHDAFIKPLLALGLQQAHYRVYEKNKF